MVFYPDEIAETARAYGRSAEIFPDMAHDLMLEENWLAVADRIRRWLLGGRQTKKDPDDRRG